MSRSLTTPLAVVTIAFIALTSLPALGQSRSNQQEVGPVPQTAPAKPKQPRKLLIFTLTRGFRHGSIPLGAKTLAEMGRKTGAFEAVESDDPAMFEPPNLRQFDAVCMLSTTGELFVPRNFEQLPTDERAAAERTDAALKKSLLDFVAGGGGLIGIHAATDCFYQWPEYGVLMGGYFNGHPWNEEVSIKLDQPDHPINAGFKGRGFKIADEIYQLREPYSREKLSVLLSLDVSGTDMTKRGIRRTDNDFAVSWVRTYEKGRVFYCSLGHRNEVFRNQDVLAHYLAGIQYALGDLTVEAFPIQIEKAGK